MNVTTSPRSTLAGAFRLDNDAAKYFGSPLVRLILKVDRITGRFGRYGVIRGSIRGNVATLTWKDANRSGWLIITFDESYRSLEGEYGVENADGKPGGVRFTARRVRWT